MRTVGREISLKAYFQAERLKQKHSAVGKITILMPALCVALSAVLLRSFFAVDSYNWWYMMIYPGMTALVCASIAGKDKKMDNRAIWAMPCNIKRVWDGKVLYGISISAIGMMLVTVLTILGAFLMETFTTVTFVIRPTIGAQLAGCVLIWLSFCWQIPVCLFLSQALGLIPMLIIHMAGYTVMAVLPSLYSFYMWFPGALTSRMMCVVLGILPNGLPADPATMTKADELLSWHSIPIGMLASVLWLVVFWVLTRKWYERKGEKA